ncbi:TPA: hypothetical protein ACTYC5_004293 [Enterobacter hormaechei]
MNDEQDELLNRLKADPLMLGHARFYAMVSQYPKVAALWDWEQMVLRSSSFPSSLHGLSHGEVVLVRFFEMIWNHQNKGFDLADAAGVLDTKERKMIADWLLDPFWP